MHVALVTDGIWPYVLGGMQKHSFYLCKYLAKNKVNVDLYHFNRSQYNITDLSFFSPEERPFINAIVVDFPEPFSFPGHYLYESYLHSKKVFEAIKPHLSKYDFIYTKGFAGWYLIQQKKKRNITCAPIAVKFHGYEMFQKPPSFSANIKNRFLLRAPVKAISLNADYVFSYGGKITNIIESLGVPANKIIALPSGVEESFVAEEIKPTGDKIKLLYLGRYERRKGIEELNEALIQYFGKKKHSSLECHFVGPIPEDKQLHLSGITYHGEIRDKQLLQNIIKEGDVLLCPSWSEGLPNVILEGMANGLAILTTDVGASAILTNQQNGWLLSEPSVEKIVKTLQEIEHCSKADLDKKKQSSLERIKSQFTWEKLIKVLLQVIEERKLIQ